MSTAIVQPIRSLVREQAAAIPTIALWKNRDRFQIGCPGNRSPRAFCFALPAAIHCEVDQILAIRRDVGALPITSPVKPLPYSKLIVLAVPQNGAYLFRRATPNNHPHTRFTRQQNMNSSLK